MIAHIRLDAMILQTLARPYRDLVTRPTGRAVRRQVVSVLQDAVEQDAHLDFSDIGVVDFSCADEIVAKLLTGADGIGVTRIVLLGLTDNHVDAIEHVLRHHGLVVVAICASNPAPRLLGQIGDDDRAAFHALAERGRSGPEPVAAALAWSVERARQSLATLAGRGCVLAHPDATFELGVVA
ncbi:MAG: hypothetical protein ABIR59_01275 [Gemmatimonadales bacterium]